jgi:acetyltransferase
MSTRPYPAELEEEVRLHSGRRVLLRPIRPEDEERHRQLFESFRASDVRFRFFGMIRDMPHEELVRYTSIDYDQEMAFLAIDLEAEDRPELGVVRTVSAPDGSSAEFAIIVSPRIQHEGLGQVLMEKIIRYEKSRGTRQIVGRVLLDNGRMLALARKLGFSRRSDLANSEAIVTLELRD